MAQVDQSRPVVLSANGLSKTYGGIAALDNVGLELRAGEIHGLCGENGAGKSTFIKILGGLVAQDHGDVIVDGERLKPGRLTDPRSISIVHQELAIVPAISVLDNVVMGSAAKLFYHRGSYRREVEKCLKAVGLDGVSPDRLAGSLSLAERQLVEIARGIFRQAKVLLLDEPTATLSDAEISRVFAAVRRLRDAGTAIVFVSHRLDEVFALTDRVTVFRGGRHILSEQTSSLTTPELVRAMLGRELMSSSRPAVQLDRRTRLELKDFAVSHRLKPLDLAIRQGEIVAIVGQLGSGAEVVVEALAGLHSDISGSVRINDAEVVNGSLKQARRNRIAYVPEDRAGRGVFLDAPIQINVTACVMDRFSKVGVLDRSGESKYSAQMAHRFNIDARRLSDEVSTLSGGNQQKVSLAKAAALDPEVLVLNEPTRGVDIGARSEIYSTLRAMTEKGVSIIFYSTDLEEILELADRVITIFKREKINEYSYPDLSADYLLKDILSGHAREGAQA